MTGVRCFFSAALAILAVTASAQPRGEVSLLGEGDDKTMHYWEVTRQKWAAQPKWLPSAAGSPPLPIAKAVELADAWLRTRHADVKQFAITSITLRSQSSSGPGIVDGWFYRLEFQPVVAGRRLWGGQFVAVILFDGTVVDPRSEPYGARRN
ncbi:MAG: hypothetical protein ACK5S1_00915 [bacterium]|jgi:hypothetical protein